MIVKPGDPGHLGGDWVVWGSDLKFEPLLRVQAMIGSIYHPPQEGCQWQVRWFSLGSLTRTVMLSWWWLASCVGGEPHMIWKSSFQLIDGLEWSCRFKIQSTHGFEQIKSRGKNPTEFIYIFTSNIRAEWIDFRDDFPRRPPKGATITSNRIQGWPPTVREETRRFRWW